MLSLRAETILQFNRCYLSTFTSSSLQQPRFFQCKHTHMNAHTYMHAHTCKHTHSHAPGLLLHTLTDHPCMHTCIRACMHSFHYMHICRCIHIYINLPIYGWTEHTSEKMGWGIKCRLYCIVFIQPSVKEVTKVWLMYCMGWITERSGNPHQLQHQLLPHFHFIYIEFTLLM